MEVIILIFGLLFGAVLKDEEPKYDAPIPERCATFDARYDIDNKDFCDHWMLEHVVPHTVSRSKK